MHDTDHGQYQSRLRDYATGSLDDVEWLMMRTHLAECAHCEAELRRPQLWNRAAPQRISADHDGHRQSVRDAAPGWTVLAGITLVIALLAFSIGYALGGL